MTPYSDILNAFTKGGITRERQLELLLRQLPEKGRSSDVPLHSTPNFNVQHPIGDAILSFLERYSKDLSGEGQDSGIQQFSMSIGNRLNDEDIKKALFLSQTATIFTRHKFSYTLQINYSPLINAREDTEKWELSHDYIRDLFRYRLAVKKGYLVLLPQLFRRELQDLDGYYEWNKPYGWIEETTFVPPELSISKVVTLNTNLDAIESLIAKYKGRHQLISLPEINVPWIRGLSQKNILRVKEDHKDELEQFQRAYHDAIVTWIESHQSLNYSKLSQQIGQDIINPQLQTIERKYRRIISLHRSLSVTGATVSLVPVAGLVVAQTLFNHTVAVDFYNLIPSTIASLFSTLTVNYLHQRSAIQELQDNAFYILWKLRH